MYRSVEEMGVWCLNPGGDSLLQISVCYKLLAFYEIFTGSKEIEIAGLHNANHTLIIGLWLGVFGPPTLQFCSHVYMLLFYKCLLSVPLSKQIHR
jgi:hypothetical protein